MEGQSEGSVLNGPLDWKEEPSPGSGRNCLLLLQQWRALLIIDRRPQTFNIAVLLEGPHVLFCLFVPFIFLPWHFVVISFTSKLKILNKKYEKKNGLIQEVVPGRTWIGRLNSRRPRIHPWGMPHSPFSPPGQQDSAAGCRAERIGCWWPRWRPWGREIPPPAPVRPQWTVLESHTRKRAEKNVIWIIFIRLGITAPCVRLCVCACVTDGEAHAQGYVSDGVDAAIDGGVADVH